MYDPISVETALVSSGGDLLIQLSDGNVINAGRVRGNPGPKGDTGEQGVRGAHGKDGIDGTNGAKWHTGVGAPEIGLGVNGDLYMDVAAMVLPIYQKVDGDWLFLANLKGGGGGGGVGATGGGAAGDGSAVIIKPGPTPPTNDNDGNAVDIGDLWWDSTTGLIYINTINGWIPISDHPPIIVSPNPPNFTNNSDPTDANKRYPVREGDAWFDSDQAALYVAVKNVDDDLVWVISTPADRSILQDEIPVGGFIFPAATQDGDTIFNDTTGLWYVYNGAKNQWIDLPPGERELSYPGILRQADPAIDETYEGEIDAADGDVYLNAPDHEAGTRLVVRKVDRKGFTWTDFIQGLISGDGIALVQTNYDDADNPQTQRVDYLIVTDITENADSFSIEVDYEHQNFDHDPLFGEEVSVRFLAQVSSPAVCVDFQEDTPEPKCAGHLWFDTSDESLTLFVYTGDEWIPAAPPVSLDGINATIDAALIVQNDLLDRVAAGEIVQTGVLDSVSTLQNKVEALEGTVIDGKWYAESRSTPREGGFDITSGGLQSMGDWDADFIRIHKTDTTGKVFTFAEIGVGDYIRIGAPGSTAVYKINDVPSGSLDWQAFGVELANSTGTPTVELTYDFEFLPSFDPSAYATIQYVDAQDDLDVKLAAVNEVTTGFRIKSDGNTLISTGTAGELALYHVKDPSAGNAEWAATKGYVDDNFINIAGQTDLDPQIFKIRQPNSEGNFRSFINIHNGEMNLYNVADPSGSSHEKWAANKGYVDTKTAGLASEEYVDEQIAAIPAPTGGVPVGSIMIWMNSTAPDGWFKLQGGTFNVNTYPQLHAYLQGTAGYSSGSLPNWSGHYPGEYGDHMATSLGTKVAARTGRPEGGAPRSSISIPNGATRTFTATGNTNAYSNGASKVTIDENWDNTTRPKTVVVHYIIKHD